MKAICEEYNYTPTRIGDLIGVSQQSASNYYTGRVKSLKPAVEKKLLEILDINEKWWHSGNGEIRKSPVEKVEEAAVAYGKVDVYDIDEVRKRFTTQIKLYSSQNGIATNRAMAEVIDMDEAYLSGVMHGHKDVTILMLQKIGNKIKANTNYTLCGVGEKFRTSMVTDASLKEEVKRLKDQNEKLIGILHEQNAAKSRGK